MDITCTRELQFDAGHKVLGHGGRCKNLHGHRYQALITCRADVLNSLGMVIDFGDIKRLVGSWVDENWDHNLLLNSNDPLVNVLTKEVLGEQSLYLFPNANPTAENIANYLFNVSKRLLKERGLKVVSVKVFETPNCSAEAKDDG